MKNPNALAGGLGGVAGGQLVVNLARLEGWDISSGWAMAIAAAASYVVLYVGREGLVGLWQLILHGTGGKRGGPDA